MSDSVKPRVLSHKGSKLAMIKKHPNFYPAPLHPVIVETCAGGATYSLQHGQLDSVDKIYIFEPYGVVAGIWDYLINDATEERLRALPILKGGESLKSWRGRNLTAPEQWLIGFNLYDGGNVLKPRDKASENVALLTNHFSSHRSSLRQYFLETHFGGMFFNENKIKI